MIYLWKIPDDYPEGLLGAYDKASSPDRFIFQEGKRIESPISPVRFRFRAHSARLRQYDDLGNSAMVPLVSEKVASVLLRHAEADAQLFEAQVEAAGKELPGYRLVNATHKVTGLDHEASEYTTIAGTDAIRGFRKFKYRSNCLGNHLMARSEEYLSHLLVSERLYDLVCASGAQGLGLYAK